jgi:hypothetical protein
MPRLIDLRVRTAESKVGISFLKAAYIVVNHDDKKNFHLSQVAYTNASHNIVSISKSDPDPDPDSTPGSNDPDQRSGTSTTGQTGPSVPIVARGIGGGVFVASIAGFFIWRRRSRTPRKILSPSDPLRPILPRK